MSESTHHEPSSAERPGPARDAAGRGWHPVAATAPQAGRIQVDLICVQCGYNLRGLLPDGRCGECGTPVQWSRAGGLAGAGDLRWLNRVRSAAETLVWTLPWAWLPLTWPLLAWALWRLGTPAPHTAGTTPLPNLPRLLALLVIPAIGGGAVLLAESATAAPRGIRPFEASLLLALLQLAAAVVMVRPLKQTGRGGSRAIAWLVIVLALLEGVALGFAIEDAMRVKPGFAANPLGWIVVGLTLISALLLYSALLRLRHGLESAVTLGQAIRAELRPWQRAEPGAWAGARAGLAPGNPEAAGSGAGAGDREPRAG